jgi:hypothetical protein
MPAAAAVQPTAIPAAGPAERPEGSFKMGVAMATAVDEDVLTYVVAALLEEIVVVVEAMLIVLCELLVDVLPALMAELSIDHQDGDKVESASFTSGALTSR